MPIDRSCWRYMCVCIHLLQLFSSLICYACLIFALLTDRLCSCMYISVRPVAIFSSGLLVDLPAVIRGSIPYIHASGLRCTKCTHKQLDFSRCPSLSNNEPIDPSYSYMYPQARYWNFSEGCLAELDRWSQRYSLGREFDSPWELILGRS
jgi:hypothetical protein